MEFNPVGEYLLFTHCVLKRTLNTEGITKKISVKESTSPQEISSLFADCNINQLINNSLCFLYYLRNFKASKYINLCGR